MIFLNCDSIWGFNVFVFFSKENKKEEICEYYGSEEKEIVF